MADLTFITTKDGRKATVIRIKRGLYAIEVRGKEVGRVTGKAAAICNAEFLART